MGSGWKGALRSRHPWLALLIVAGCVGALTSCTAGTPPAIPAQTSPPGADTSSAAAIADHFDATCEASRGNDGRSQDADDFTVGILSYAGGMQLTGPLAPDVTPRAANGVTFFKTGATLPAHSTATITIVGQTARDASIIVEKAPDGGVRSVTYTNCTDTPRWWVGGFQLWGAEKGCVTVEVLSNADKTPQRGRISLNAGDCG